MVKNTTKIAAKEAGIDGIDEHLRRPIGDRIRQGRPGRGRQGLRDFAKPGIGDQGWRTDGQLLSADEIRLADLESREVLLAKMAGAMKASLVNAASLFNAPLAKTARVVEALRHKLEADETPTDQPEA